MPEYLRQKLPGAIRSPPLAFFFVGVERRHVINTTATLASRGIQKDRFDLASVHQLSNLLGCCSCDPLNETPHQTPDLGTQYQAFIEQQRN